MSCPEPPESDEDGSVVVLTHLAPLIEQTSIQFEPARSDATHEVRVGIQADKVKTHNANHTHRRDRVDAKGRNMGGSL